MTYQSKAKALYDLINQGKMNEALDQFYHDNVRVIEMPMNEVREGKAEQAKSLQQWAEMQEAWHGSGIGSITSDEDAGVTMVESWIDITMKNGPRMKMEEVAIQKWQGDKIIEEKFYYHNPMAGQQQA